MKTSLVVLTLNEIDGMKKVMPRVRSEWVDEVIIVDGRSTDGTREEAVRQHYRVVVQERPGRGEAFRVGLENTVGDGIVYFSPDGNERPEDIPKLVELLQQGADMVVASRFAAGSRSDDAGMVRRFGNWMFTSMINLFFGANVTDAVNGFRAVTRRCMVDIDTRAQWFEIEIEMTIRAAKKGYKILEIPTVEPRRIGGKAKLNTVIDGWRYLRLILNELFGRRE